MFRSIPLLLLASGAGCQTIFGLEAPSRVVDAAVADVSDAPSDAVDARGVQPTLELLTVVTSGLDTSTYTFEAVPTGTAASDRVLIIVAHGRNPTTSFGPASLTVNAVAATKQVAVNEDASAATAALFTYPAPAGTSATMVLTYAAGAGDRRVALAVWAAYGLTSEVPQATQVASTDATNPVQAMFQMPAGGFAIAGVSMSAVVDGTVSTWSGLPEAYEHTVEQSLFSAASNFTPSGGGPVTVVHSSTDTTTSHQMVVATFR